MILILQELKCHQLMKKAKSNTGCGFCSWIATISRRERVTFCIKLKLSFVLITKYGGLSAKKAMQLLFFTIFCGVVMFFGKKLLLFVRQRISIISMLVVIG